MSAVLISVFLLILLIWWLIISHKGQTLFKVLLIPVSFMTMLGLIFAIESFKGWPSIDELPNEFRVHWVIIDEPDNFFLTVEKLSDEVLYQNNLFRYRPNFNQRLYRVPYSRDQHEAMQKMQNALKQGKYIKGTNKKGSMDKKGQGQQADREGSSDGGKGDNPFAYGPEDLMFYELPPSKLLPKNPR